jgi:hypothetical protein
MIPDRPKLTQTQIMEIQAGADALLKPGGGGVAVWVRRDDLYPRVAVRLSTTKPGGEEIDAAKMAAILATLRIGVDRVTQAMADQMVIERDLFASMVDDARKILAPHFQTATRVVRGGGGS